jgi:hypothetical protein
MNPLNRAIALLQPGSEILIYKHVNSGFLAGLRLALASIERVQERKVC